MTEAVDVQRVTLLREHCRHCDGKGRVVLDWRCHPCGGTGFIVRGPHDAASSMDADPTDAALAQLRADNLKLAERILTEQKARKDLEVELAHLQHDGARDDSVYRTALERIADRLPAGSNNRMAAQMATIACEALGRKAP